MDTFIDPDKVPKMPTMDELLETARKGRELADHHRMEMARALLMGGIQLIPSDLLNDNQFMVSTAIYEAAKKLPSAHVAHKTA